MRFVYFDLAAASLLMFGFPLITNRLVSRLTVLPGRRMTITTYGPLLWSRQRTVSMEQILPPAAITGNQHAHFHFLRVINDNGNGSMKYTWGHNPTEPRTLQHELALLDNLIKYNRPLTAAK
jgi:hypothetical protein